MLHVSGELFFFTLESARITSVKWMNSYGGGKNTGATALVLQS